MTNDPRPHDVEPADPQRARPEPSKESILADEAQTERQAPDNASPGEAAGS